MLNGSATSSMPHLRTCDCKKLKAEEHAAPGHCHIPAIEEPGLKGEMSTSTYKKTGYLHDAIKKRFCYIDKSNKRGCHYASFYSDKRGYRYVFFPFENRG